MRWSERVVEVEPATPGDLSAVMEVEEDWPAGQRASMDQFRSRLERFPEGFLIARVDGVPVGVSTSCLTRYDPDNVDQFSSWSAVTHDGYLPPHGVAGANALYIVSTGVRQSYRDRGVGEALIRAQIALSARLGLAYCVSGSVLPGYDAYCREHGCIEPTEYVFTREGGALLDPLLGRLEQVGLLVPDRRHVVANYYPSPESRDYSALVVHRNGCQRGS